MERQFRVDGATRKVSDVGRLYIVFARAGDWIARRATEEWRADEVRYEPGCGEVESGLAGGELRAVHSLLFGWEGRVTRRYDPAQTPYARVMNASEVSAESKAKLRALHESNNPMALVRRIEQEKKEIERCRLLRT